MKPESGIAANRRLHAAARNAPARRWAAFAAACGMLSIGCLAATADGAWEADRPGASVSASTAAADPQDFERWTDLDLSAESIDTLRRDAHAGDADAAVAVTSRLVDRYERGGSTDDLFEAMVWIDRYYDHEAFAQSGLIARLQQRDCRHKVLRLHWVCDVAE